MWVCVAASLLGFGGIAMLSPVWIKMPLEALANLILLMIVPIYAAVLIRKLRNARARAEHESQVKSQLLANVSHELRTPLAGIVSSAQLLKEETKDALVVKRVDTMLRLSKDLMSEINNLLDSAKYEARALKIDSARFHLREVMEQVKAALAPTAAVKGIAFSMVIDERIRAQVEGDPHYLSRVLMNIGGNAVKFTEQGKVEISLKMIKEEADAYQLRFICKDTGIGIPQHLHQKIFEPFFQASTGTTRKYGGTGLGMSIAREIVAMMGGELSLESEPGRGSLFCFDLRMPKVPAPPQPAPAGAPLAIPRDKRILVADDHSTNLMLLREMLERDGHIVTAAQSGKAALETLSRQSFDLVFLDFNMGDIDGAAALQIYRFGKTHPAPVYIFTADTTAATARRLQECGAVGVLHKPISIDGLRRAIANVATTDAKVDEPAHPELVVSDYIDDEAINELKKITDEPDFLVDILSTAVADIDRACKRLLCALDQNDMREIRLQAHALNGICMNVGAMRLSAVASKLARISQDELRRCKAQSKNELAMLSTASLAALRSILLSLAH
jgi:two-component system sensor histidine kinase RpfC